MSVYRQYFKEKKVWLIRSSRILVANLISSLESFYSLNYAWALELLFALILSLSFQFTYLQDENTAVMAYQLFVNTGFWFVFLRMISKYLRGKRLKNERLNVFLSIGLYSLLWIPFGFDLTDEGWRLMGAYSLWNYPEFYENKASVVGSDFLLGLWLKLGPNMLIWSRLSFLIVLIIITHYSYKLLRLFYTTNVLGILLVISIIYFSTNVRYVADYNNLGVMFLLAAAYHLTRSEQSERNGLHAATAGVFLSFAVLCNFSLIIFMLVFPAYNIFFRKKFSAGYFSISFVISVFILYLLLYAFNVHEVYWAEVSSLVANLFGSSAGESWELSYHSSDYLLNRYLSDGKTLGVLSLINMGILFAGTLLLPRIHKAARIFVFTACYLLIWAISSYYRFEFVVSSLLLALLFLSTFIQNVEQKNFRAWYWAISLFFLTFLGSNNGVWAITFSGGTILLTPIILITLKSRLLKWDAGTFSLRFHTIGAFFFIMIFSYWSKPSMIYRDLPAESLTSGFSHSSLLGIVSNEAKVDAVEGLFASLEKEVKSHEKVLFINNLSTVEYLSGRSFPMQWHMDKAGVERKEALINSKNGPQYLMINYKDPMDPNWPQSANESTRIDRGSMKYYKKFSERLEPLAKNDVFGLFRID